MLWRHLKSNDTKGKQVSFGAEIKYFWMTKTTLMGTYPLLDRNINAGCQFALEYF